MNQSDRKHVLIIGAGPAGLTAGYDLSGSGYPCTIVEKDVMVGGISRTVSYRDYRFDIGGHRFFTKIERVEKMWRDVMGEDFLRRGRLSRIYYNKKFFDYPLSLMNCLKGLGAWNSLLILLSYLQAACFPSKTEETFEQWVCNRFGRRLYEIFFKSYTEKVWGIPGTEIRAEWAAQRIRGLSLAAAVKHALMGNGHKGKTPKTLIEAFDYPRFGPGQMWQRVADSVTEKGSRIILGAGVEVLFHNGTHVEAVSVTGNGGPEKHRATDFISSMPIGELILKLRPEAPGDVLEAARALKHRDFLTVALIVGRADLFPDNWIYIHEAGLKVGRIQNFKNWSPEMVPDQAKTCLGLEYFCFEGDSLWTMADRDLIELAKRELESLGFARASEVEDGHVVRMPKAYPCYDSNYESALATARKYLAGFENLQVIGRNGAHRYNNQDHSVLMAMLAAENIQGKAHDLWQVNTEAEYHEEMKGGE
ncbi:MAG: NAD(P)/FAD-dependent oxidoreductase [Desulfobacteraceae bacterium]|nr:NAD(P)/FAD-dependent oxidoreductase [Desulfobacteraceae bacterium]